MENIAKTRILIVEDEVSLARSIQIVLEHERYEVEIAQNGYEALGKVVDCKWDLILLDLMLPGLDGFEVCRKIRQNHTMPVIILSAKDSTSDKVTGLDIGADDYLTKPFMMEELLARIRVRLRNSLGAKREGNKIIIKDLIIDQQSRQVIREGQQISLSRREFDFLTYLAENAGAVLSREAILNHVWGYDFYGDAKVVDVFIHYLRSKIDEPFTTPLLHTIRGVGYTLREDK